MDTQNTINFVFVKRRQLSNLVLSSLYPVKFSDATFAHLLFTIFDRIGSLVGLEELQLFGNNLSGPVPSSIGKLVNLKLLSLGEYTGGNDFLGAPLPSCLSSLKKLAALFMANCNIKGILPAWLGDLTGVYSCVLDLFFELFHRSEPAIKHTLHRRFIFCYINKPRMVFQFIVTPPAFDVECICHDSFLRHCCCESPLTELRQLDLQRNNLCGVVPPTVGCLSNLLYLNLKVPIPPPLLNAHLQSRPRM